MPYNFTSPYSVQVPKPSSIDLTEARIKQVVITTSDGQVDIEVQYSAGKIEAGNYKEYYHSSHTFENVGANQLFKDLETAIFAALKAAGKLPNGTAS